MAKPNVYVLGSKPRLKAFPTDENGDFFTPSISRISVKSPDGEIYTVSGAGTDETLIVGSGYLYFKYEPETIGWYEYEGAVEDSEGNKIVATHGFEVIDRLY